MPFIWTLYALLTLSHSRAVPRKNPHIQAVLKERQSDIFERSCIRLHKVSTIKKKQELYLTLKWNKFWIIYYLGTKLFPGMTCHNVYDAFYMGFSLSLVVHGFFIYRFLIKCRGTWLFLESLSAAIFFLCFSSSWEIGFYFRVLKRPILTTSYMLRDKTVQWLCNNPWKDSLIKLQGKLSKKKLNRAKF